MSIRRAGSAGSGRSGAVAGSVGAPVVQLDLFAGQEQAAAAEQEQAAAAEQAVVEAAAQLAAAGSEVIDTATLARLCRAEADALDERDRDDQARFGHVAAGRGFFAEEARRVRVLAGWLDERGVRDAGRVPRAGVGWPCVRCDVAPGRMCGTRQHDGRQSGGGVGFVHCGRGFKIGFTSPGAGWGSHDGPGPETDPAERCSPTCEDGPGGAWRGRCLGCGWRGPIRGREDGGENAAVEDVHDHTHPGWRDLPVIDARPASVGDNPRAQSRAEQRWSEQARAAVPAGWFEAGGPVRTRREPPGARHVPGRAPGGGYDLSAPGGTQDDEHQDEHQGDEQGEGRGA